MAVGKTCLGAGSRCRPYTVGSVRSGKGIVRVYIGSECTKGKSNTYRKCALKVENDSGLT